MKKIFLLITNFNCGDVTADCLVYNECNTVLNLNGSIQEIHYNESNTEQEIKDGIQEILDFEIGNDYVIIINWVGGRPNDRN